MIIDSKAYNAKDEGNMAQEGRKSTVWWKCAELDTEK